MISDGLAREETHDIFIFFFFATKRAFYSLFFEIITYFRSFFIFYSFSFFFYKNASLLSMPGRTITFRKKFCSI